MRKNFIYKDLVNSENFYSPIFEAIFNNNWKYYNNNAPAKSSTKRIQDTLNAGLDNFYYINRILYKYNQCFFKLLTEGEVLVAFPLVRIQIENLCAIYAEVKYPFEILYRIFEKGNRLEDIKRNNIYIKPSEIRKEIDEIFGTNIVELYKKYSGFIHPSIAQTKVKIKTYYKESEGNKAIKKYIKLYEQDMVLVNQTITKVLLTYLENIKLKNK